MCSCARRDHECVSVCYAEEKTGGRNDKVHSKEEEECKREESNNKN